MKMNNKFLKKILLISIILIILISLAVFVSAYLFEAEDTIVFDGWNLLYGFTEPEQLTKDYGPEAVKYVKAIYTFIPTTKEYIRLYPNPETSKFYKISDYDLKHTASWVYFEGIETYLRKVGRRIVESAYLTTEYALKEEYPNLESMKLSRGWNLIGPTGNMYLVKEPFDYFTWEEVQGNCEFENIYFYEADDLEWTKIQGDNFKISNIYVHMGFAIKVKDNCHLGERKEELDISSPPAIPN